jgi:hypothetical protein
MKYDSSLMKGRFMDRSMGNTIADSLQLSLGYAERLLKDVAADRFARFATPGGQTVESNHGAFVMGHLCLYAPRITQQLGRSDLVQSPPERFENIFSKDAKCVDDPDGSIYPPMSEVAEYFTAAYGKALTALCEVDDTVLQKPNPTGGRMSELFPTLGSMHAFYVGGHMMMHLGQMSAWRRMLGLQPA